MGSVGEQHQRTDRKIHLASRDLATYTYCFFSGGCLTRKYFLKTKATYSGVSERRWKICWWECFQTSTQMLLVDVIKSFERYRSSTSASVLKMAQYWTYEPPSKQYTHTACFVFLLLSSYLLVYFNFKTYCWICSLEEGKKSHHRELLLQFVRPMVQQSPKVCFFTWAKCPTSFPQDRAILLSPGGLKSQRMLSRTYFDSVHTRWKYVTKVRVLQFCDAFHLSCPCYHIIKAWQYSSK